MQTIGRKAYFKFGDNVIAVEILAQTTEQFKELSGITLTDDKAFICDVNDCLGVKTEKYIGTAFESPTNTAMDNLNAFNNSFKMIVESDIDLVSKQLNVSKKLLSVEECGVQKEYFNSSYFKDSFKGLIEIPNSPIATLNNSLTFMAINKKIDDKVKLFIPVYLFKKSEVFFDSYDKDFLDKPWVVFFLGTDNSSSGERFATEEEALKFISKGFHCGYQNLRFYNS